LNVKERKNALAGEVMAIASRRTFARLSAILDIVFAIADVDFKLSLFNDWCPKDSPCIQANMSRSRATQNSLPTQPCLCWETPPGAKNLGRTA
jgi:hypothetical protein